MIRATLLAIAASLALAACASPPADITLTPERGAALARGAHYLACTAVVDAHAAGTLTGATFNKAKADCITADTLLDAADGALMMGQAAVAAPKVQQALTLIEAAKAVTPAKE